MNDLDKQLFDAVKGGEYDKCEKLIKNGADINAMDHNGYVPLHYATRHNYINYLDTVALLLSAGADSSAHSNHEVTPLSYAVYYNNMPACILLLITGADVNTGDNTNWTALSIATRDANIGMIKKLLQYNADVNMRYYFKDGKSILEAMQTSNVLTMRTLAKKYTDE